MNNTCPTCGQQFKNDDIPVVKFQNNTVPFFNEECISFLNDRMGNICMSLAFAVSDGDKAKAKGFIMELLSMKAAIIEASRGE